MRIWDRWELAFQSHFGSLLLLLVGILLLLGGVYLFLLYRQRQRDRLAYLFTAFYEETTALMNGWKEIGRPKADIFGRRFSVKGEEEQVGVALVPPPDLLDEVTLERWRLFLGAAHLITDPLTAKSSWTYAEDRIVMVEEGLCDQRGAPLSNLRHLHLDGRLTIADCEHLLLSLAHSLSALHQVQTDNGRRLFHGWLLPSSLFVDADTHGRITKISLADTGIVFTLGAKKVQQRIETLAKGDLPIEKYRGRELIEELSMLAPEQRDPELLHKVGTASDFYQFGALGLWLLSGQVPSQEIDWSAVPEQWKPFLQRCLEPKRTDRPRDFLELEDWLNDPELALTHKELEEKQSAADLGEEASLDQIQGMMEEWKSNREATGQRGERSYLRAQSAMKMSNWKLAKEQLEKTIQRNPNHAEALAQMGIVLYEMQQFDEAEEYYRRARAIDPRAARLFREHIAFKV